MAVGGKSYPRTGATGTGMRIASSFGIHSISDMPALVPFVLSDESKKYFKNIAGVTIDVQVSVNGKSDTGSMIFTHKGISGPVVLRISNYYSPGDTLVIDFLPDENIHRICSRGREKYPAKKLINVLQDYLPYAFLKCINEMCPQLDNQCSQISKVEEQSMAAVFHKYLCKPDGTEGYKKAEVMKGGIDTKEISSKTLEAVKVPGLYFGGEIIDVTGNLGGYNLHWAWACASVLGNH
jgi:predicted Rossmann fold flavoprotein